MGSWRSAEPGTKRGGDLPAQLTPLIGRVTDAAEIGGLLLREDVRVVTLVGTGGVGKTRLALQLAADVRERFADGVRIVWLISLTDPRLVPTAIAQALDLREEGNRPLSDTLIDHLRPRSLLLVLDNFEHLLLAASTIADLLVACPQLKCLATSRAPLRISGEHEYPVRPLEVPDLANLPPLDKLSQIESVRLLVARAQAVQPTFRLTLENALSVAAICYRLDGLPLAIELAAARTRVLPPGALLARLAPRLPMLKGGGLDQPVRHQTMRAAIDWSHNLLSPTEQALFRRLAVFNGGCTLEAVESVCAGEGLPATDLLELIEALVTQSLLQQSVVGEAPRFSMLETLREYALERLEESSELNGFRLRHARCYLSVAEKAERRAAEAEGARQGYLPGGWLEELLVEEPNLRAAMDWAGRTQQAELSLRLCTATWRYWYHRGQLSEGRRRFAEALSLPQPTSEVMAYLLARTQALEDAARLAQFQHDYANERALLHERVAVARELGDRPGVATGLQEMGMAAFHLGRTAEAAAYLDESMVLAREIGSVRTTATAVMLRGLISHYEGDLSQARTLLEESVRLQWQELDRPDNDSLACLGFLLLDQGETAEARKVWEELIEFSQASGFRRGIGLGRCVLGSIACRDGDWGTARSLLEQGLLTWQEIGEHGGWAFLIACCAEWAAAEGRREQAEQLARSAAWLWDVHGTPVAHALQARLAYILDQVKGSCGSSLGATCRGSQAESIDDAVAYALDALRQKPREISANPATRSDRQRSPLTEREWEVAWLVKEGLTNREIAARLVIAERTVSAHVEHILDKLGFRSRAQIAAWVGERGSTQIR